MRYEATFFGGNNHRSGAGSAVISVSCDRHFVLDIARVATEAASRDFTSREVGEGGSGRERVRTQKRVGEGSRGRKTEGTAKQMSGALPRGS